jgi:protein XagA
MNVIDNMRSRRRRRALLARRLFFPAVTIVNGGAEMAWGGAWLLAPGEGQAIAYSAFSDTTRAFDSQGRLISVHQSSG